MRNGGVIAIDVGTSSAKSFFITAEGRVISTVQVEYEYEAMEGGWFEQSPLVWWKAVCSCLQTLLKKDVQTDCVKSVAITGQYPSILPIDKDLNPLRKAILWLDTRAEKQAKAINAELGRKVGAAWPVPKIMWVMENEADIHRNTYKYIQALDYIRLKLTHACVTDWTCAWALGYDKELEAWDNELLDFAHLSIDAFPSVQAPLSVCGLVSRQASMETGLKEGTPVVTGGNDISMAMIGSNGLKPDTCFDVTGTSTFLGLTVRETIQGLPNGIFLTNGVLKGTWMLGCVINSTGSVFEWYKNNFLSLGEKADPTFQSRFYETVNQKTTGKVPLRSDPYMVPFFAGMLSPYVDDCIRGAIIGLSLNHKAADIFHAIFESTAFAIKLNLEALHKIIPGIDTVVVSGGGSNSDVWCQMKADITSMTVRRTKVRNSSLVGAAILGAISAELFSDFSCCSDTLIQIEREFQPMSKVQETYEQRYNQFKRYLDFLHQ